MLNSGSSSYYSSGNVYPTGRGRSDSYVPPPSSLQSRLNMSSTSTPPSAYGSSNTNNRLVSSSTSPYTAVQTKAMFPKSRRPSPTSATTLVFDGGFENRLSVSAPQFVPDSYTTPVPGPRSNVSTPVSIKPKLAPYKGGNHRGRNINRRSTNRTNNVSSGNGGERNPSQPPSNNNIHTPQNLRDNPERLAKVKTEMCQYYEEGGAKACPFGANCNYAHGKHELKFKYTTLSLMQSSGQIVNANTYLARPCMTWVSTGACPFGRRCAAIHDPSICGPTEYPSWLPAATAKTNAQVIVDRLGAHRDSAIHQENPLIPQSIWENCRPSHHGRGDGCYDGGIKKSALSLEQEWEDTYGVVCNSSNDVSIFTGGVRNTTNIPVRKVTELQKLCIVRHMHSSSGQVDLSAEDSSQVHRDYVFTPTHSLHSELCMILQARYFILADVDYSGYVSPKDIVKEISFDEYTSRTTPWVSIGHGFNPSKVVSAHEVVFAPKAEHNANLSIWFDAEPVKLEQSQIKRSRRLKQKKKTQITSCTPPNGNGALISRTSTADFPCGAPEIDPFVSMLPAEENDDSHGLIMAIIEHRIDSIILTSKSSSANDEYKKRQLYLRMKKLQKTFIAMSKFHKRWVWPKRTGLERITHSTRAPPGNIMPYIPSMKSKSESNKSPCAHWNTFVKTIQSSTTGCGHLYEMDTDDSQRLSIFHDVDDRDNENPTSLPHITPFVYDWWKSKASSSKDDAAWKEILLNLPKDGKWQTALNLHLQKKRSDSFSSDNVARSLPLSTIPFVHSGP